MVRSQIVRAVTTPAVVLGLAAALCGRADAQKLDVPYEPTTPEIVKEMLSMAKVGPQDVVYDLGSGDGRIVVAALKDLGARKAVGIDIDPQRIAEAKANAARAGVTDRATFVEGDLFKFDFREATVLTMYLLPSVNLRLRPKILSDLRPGTRVVSHRFDMDEWKPDRQTKVGTRNVYFWIVPAKVGGRWQWEDNGRSFNLELQQTFQNISGRLHADGKAMPIQDARIEGENIHFTAPMATGTMRFRGRVAGNQIDATVESSGSRKVTARRLQ